MQSAELSLPGTDKGRKSREHESVDLEEHMVVLLLPLRCTGPFFQLLQFTGEYSCGALFLSN